MELPQSVNGESYDIGNEAFKSKDFIETVMLTDGINRVGYGAFEDCISLESITIPYGTKIIEANSFAGCTSMTEVVIPNSVTTIEKGAFFGCSSLEKMELPITFEHFGVIFGEKYYPNTYVVKQYVNNNRGYFYLPQGLTDVAINGDGVLANEVFANCISLKEVSILENITEIGYQAFKDCTSLQKVNVANSVKRFNFNVFDNCTSLNVINYLGTIDQWAETSFNSATCNQMFGGGKLYFNDVKFNQTEIVLTSVVNIGDYAFAYFKDVTSVTLPATLKTVGYGAFDYDTNIKRVNFAGNLGQWAEIEFAEIDVSNYRNCEISNPTYYAQDLHVGDVLVTQVNTNDLTLNKVKNIGSNAFINCKSITDVVLSSTVKSVGSNAFYGCSVESASFIGTIDDWAEVDFANAEANPMYGLGQLIINGKAVTGDVVLTTAEKIGGYTFNFSTITGIEIPETVKNIGGGAFNASLVNANFLGTVDQWAEMDFGSSGANPMSVVGSLTINGNKITEVVLKDAKKIGKYAFNGNIGITKIDMSKAHIEYIGDYAFDKCSTLQEIFISADVKSMGINSFLYCNALNKVSFAGTIDQWVEIDFLTILSEVTYANPTTISQNLYINGESVTEVVLTTASKIGAYAFSDCGYITKITISPSVKSIGEFAFVNRNTASSIEYVNFTGTIDQWAEIDFENESSSPVIKTGELHINNEKVTEVNLTTAKKVGNGAFINCADITSVTMADTVERIGDIAFAGCINISVLKLSDKITYIGYSAFENCYTITNLLLPASLKQITDRAFYGCGGITELTMPASLESVGSLAFTNCDKIERVNYTGTMDQWSQIYFDYMGYTDMGSSITNPVAYTDELYINGELVTDVVLTTAGEISANAFYNFKSLNSITISPSVKEIYDAFSGCDNLTDVNYLGTVDEWSQINFASDSANPVYKAGELKIQGKVVNELTLNAFNIGSFAFAGCNSITKVTLGPKVYSVQDNAFYNCNNIVEAAYTGTLEQWMQINFASEKSNPMYYTGKLVIQGKEITELNLTSEKISAYVFAGCESITKVTINPCVKEIGKGAFAGCVNMLDVNYTGTIDQWLNIKFGNAMSNPMSLAGKLVINGEEITTLNLTANRIGDYAFAGCNSITEVVLGEGVKQLGYGTFSDCVNLSSLEIDDGVYDLGNYTFQGCTSLPKGIVISKNMERFISPFDYNTNIFYLGTEAELNAVNLTAGYIHSYSEEYPYVNGVTYGRYWHYVDDVPTIWEKP